MHNDTLYITATGEVVNTVLKLRLYLEKTCQEDCSCSIS